MAALPLLSSLLDSPMFFPLHWLLIFNAASALRLSAYQRFTTRA